MIKLALLGILVGSIVLGIGGRLLMRLLAFVTPEAPRFTVGGTLEIVLAGAIWGGLTTPLLIVFASLENRLGSLFGPVFGVIVMILALIVFVPLTGFDGNIDAPWLFVVGTLTLFPLLFVLFGAVAQRIGNKVIGSQVRIREH